MPAVPEPAPQRLPDWEAFYRDYRKPGYVAGFEITSKLGGGAFGLVFRARKESIGKDYAIKFLKVEDGEVRQAVLRELEQVQYFAQVDHPNLVQIEDRGEVDGIPYLVMQYAGSDTLRDRMPADGKPATGDQQAELLGYFLQACRGVAALHERSLVHFDLKPANVFLKGPVARVGDYGLSKLVTHSRGSLTMGRGTPYYMAPEMLQRRGDHRSDVYSLGVMLYELLCGKVPFTGDSEWEVLKKHETQTPDFPAHLQPVPRAVLQRCLQKDPDARFQSVHEIVQVLGGPASATGSGQTEAAGDRAGADAGPAGGSQDPYAAFREASREAYKHAQQIARDALAGAREVSHKAAQMAREAMQESMQQTRADQARRWTAWRERRRLRRDAMRRFREEMVPPPLPRRRRSGGRVLAFLVLLAVLFVWVFRAEPQPVAREVAVGAPAAPTAPVVGPHFPVVHHTGAGTLYASWDVPIPFEATVSAVDPAWATEAKFELPVAAVHLRQRLDALAAVAPFRREARKSDRQWPAFVLARDPAKEHRIDDFLAADDFDEGTAAALAIDADALAAAAARFDALDFGDPEDRAHASRLHRLLGLATGCDEIELVEDAGSKSKLRTANRGLGTAWQWFLHEVAFRPATWQAFRALRGLR